jgi:UDP-GlcNAc:undecaprenyl-phosphate GlcNAc-1-phosphate transferase
MVIFSLNGSPLVSIILITSLCGALVGFLPFNFNPAKTFMGDTGSNFIGYCLSILSIIGMAKTYTAIVLIAPLIVFGLPLFDTSFAIVRRLIKGKSIKAVFKPDAGHLHHRLIKHGFTQKQAVLILYAVTAFLGIFAIILIESGIWKATSFALIILIMCLVGYKEVVKQKLLVGDRYEPKKGDETLLFERDEDVQNKDQIRMEDLDHIRKEK